MTIAIVAATAIGPISAALVILACLLLTKSFEEENAGRPRLTSYELLRPLPAEMGSPTKTGSLPLQR